MCECVSILGLFVLYITEILDGVGNLAGMPLHFATRYGIILAFLKY